VAWRLTVAQARKLGLVQKGPARRSSEPNAAERDYAERVLEPRRLAGELREYTFEGCKLRLGWRTFYTADWFARAADGTEELHEVKVQWSTGEMGARDDARVKLKCAAALYPEKRFYLAVRSSGPRALRRWDVRLVPAGPMPASARARIKAGSPTTAMPEGSASEGRSSTKPRSRPARRK
jgi:hypothetical protein